VTFRRQIPVLIFERNEAGRRLIFFKRYADRLLFIGRLPVLSLLRVGTNTMLGARFRKIMQDELWSILSIARLDDKPYQVLDFSMKRKRLTIYVTSAIKQSRGLYVERLREN
jgi:hypothetical protein